MNPLSPRPYWRTLGSVGRAEAAAILGVSTYVIDRMRREGQLKEIHAGRCIMIPTQQLRLLLGEIDEEGKEQPPAAPPAPIKLSRRGRQILSEALDRVSH